MPKILLRLVGLRRGGTTPQDGRYVVFYDPTVRDGQVIVTTTRDPALAKRFDSLEDAGEYWRQSYGVRPDLKPNRPLTAFSVEFANEPTKVVPAAPDGAFSVYVIFKNPKDAPDERFVVREQWVLPKEVHMAPTGIAASTLEEARAALPPGLTLIMRSPEDDPAIVETWI